MIEYLVWVLGVLGINKLAGIIAKRRAEKHLIFPYRGLPDIFQETLPILPTHVPDYLLLFSILYCKFDNGGFSSSSVDVLLYSLSLRPFFVIVTTLPTCMKKPIKQNNWYSKFFHTTHDLMFSGHTCLFIFLGKLIGGNLGNLVQIIFPITLIQARQHYTIDVLVSMVVYNCISFGMQSPQGFSIIASYV